MADEDVTRILIDLVRDQARVLASIAEGVAVNADRQARITIDTDSMRDVLQRLDTYLVREEAANAKARAEAEEANIEETAALTRLYDTLRAGLQSSTGQRVIQTLVLVFLYWLNSHGYLGPAAASPGGSP